MPDELSMAVVGARFENPKRRGDRFKEAARELETDDDPARFEQRFGKLVKHKPVEKPE